MLHVEFPITRAANLIGSASSKEDQHGLAHVVHWSALFQRAFLAPCETVRPKVGLLIFEFSRFYPPDYELGREFTADLDAFLGKLPAGWRYAVELRNRHWLQPEYFAMLRRHGVAHAFNSWDAMPAVTEQMAMAGSETSDNFYAARFLLKPGGKYEEAVKDIGVIE